MVRFAEVCCFDAGRRRLWGERLGLRSCNNAQYQLRRSSWNPLKTIAFRSARMTSLLELIEERMARSERAINRLREEQAQSKQEAEQLRALLETVLATTENDCVSHIGSVLPKLEGRIKNLVAAP